MYNSNKIKETFNEGASNYDEQRKKLIPCFHDFYLIPVSIIEANTETPKILDIGAGTGLFSSFLLEKYPNADLTLIDLSEKMIDIAKKRFSNVSNVHYIIDDYTTHAFEKQYDIIISSLSIHHLEDEAKKQLYKRIFSILKLNGVFVNADQILGLSEFINQLYKNDWRNKIENSGLTTEQLNAAYERTKIDKMAPLEDQLMWLKDCGFKDVDCIYKYFNFVVLFGRKV